METILIIKLIAVIIGSITGFTAGVIGSTAGDHYEFGLSRNQINHLKQKSWIFNKCKKYGIIPIIGATPITFFIFGGVSALWLCFDENSCYTFFSIYGKLLGICTIIYLICLLAMYAFGYFWCTRIQIKYEIYKID